MDAKNKDPFAWGRHVAVAGAYAACYELTRYFSFSHWMLPAGLRLACLLLVPRRFWAALAVGEMLPVSEMALLHVSSFGALWAVLVSIPTVACCMPAVALLQRHNGLRRADGEINMGFILLATLACALISACVNSLALATVVMGDGSTAPSVSAPIFLAWLLGGYLGALALTPCIMAAHELIARQPVGSITLRSVVKHPLVRDTLFIAVPLLGALMLLAARLTDGPLQCVRLAMALPVLALTWRHGWHGSAVSGMLSAIAMASTSFHLRDPSMIQAQTVLAFVISTSLLFGVRVERRLAARRAKSVRAAPAGHSHR